MDSTNLDRLFTGRQALPILHSQRLAYRFRTALPALFGGDADLDTLPEVCIEHPFSETPVLILNGEAAPPEDFSYFGMTLKWAFGSGINRTIGSIKFRDEMLIGSGLITTSAGSFSVELELVPVYYQCLLSANAGAHVASGGDGSIQLHTANIDWNDATWADAGLQFEYTVKPGVGIGNPSLIQPQFNDTATGNSWTPFGSVTTMSDDKALQFDAAGSEPDPDDRSGLSPDKSAFKTVFPTRMLAEFDIDPRTFVGAIVVDELAQPPLVYAVRGTYIDTPPQVVPKRSGELAAGSALAGPDGTLLINENMTPFLSVPTSNGPQYSEVVQQAAVSDFYDILKFYMPDDLLTMAAPTDPSTNKPIRPTLDPTVQGIAAVHGADGTDPAQWYASLAVPYMAQALSKVNDDFAPKLNAIRARKQISLQMSTASVYNAQLPLLYAYRFGKLHPNIQDFLNDQISNNTAHAQEIAADVVAWKQQALSLMSNPKPDDVKAFNDIVDTLAAAGENNRYWAYWLFRYMTSAPAVAELQSVSIAPGQNNTAFARSVQTGCAILSILDPSGVFTKEYVKVMTLIQLGNVLPQLLDFSGNLDAYSYIVPKIVQAFIDRYASSTDPDIIKAVATLREALDADTISQLIGAFLGIASAITGAYEWKNLTDLFSNQMVGKYTLAFLDLFSAAMAAGGLALFIIGVEGWEKLDKEGKANLVIGGIELFANMTLSIVKRGAAIAQIFTTQASPWEALKMVLNPFEDNVELARNTILRGTMRRILGDGRRFPENDEYVEMDTFLDMETEANAPEALSSVERFLGKNLDEVAIRIGAVFAIVNLIMSAIALSESSDPLSTAENALFVASASVEVIAFVGGWILGAAGVAEIAGIAVATIISACTFVAAALALAGLIVLLVMLFEHHPTPIESFATGAAKDAGFYMPFAYEIESFAPFLQPGQLELVAVSLSSDNSANTLRIGADLSLRLAPFDNTTATGIFLVSDQWGRARFTSIPDSPAAAPLCLALDVNQNLVAAAYSEMTKPPTTPDPTFKPQIDTSQLWVGALLATPNVVTFVSADGQTITAAVSGDFTFSPVANPSVYLDLSGGQPTLSQTSVSIKLTMVPLMPQGLAISDILMSITDRDRFFLPSLRSQGSSPKTWTITPQQPDSLNFDPLSGTLTQKLGIAAPVTPQTSYTLSCQNSLGAAQATFNFQVKGAV